MAPSEGFDPSPEDKIWSGVKACLMFVEGGKRNFNFDEAGHERVCEYAIAHPAQAELMQSIVLEREITTLDGILALLPTMQNSHPVVREGTL